jgi:hypothetical protein
VAALSSLVLLLLALGSIALAFAGVVFLGLDGRNDPRSLLFKIGLFLGIPIAIQAAARILLTRLFVRLGWLTAEEASDFTWMVHKYPPSCWEPFDEDE